MLAVSRLYLDNFANLQASWVTQGLQIGQMSLRFGANDMGSVMIEENVVAAAGTSFHASEAEIRQAIAEAGYAPRRRNVFYQLSPSRPPVGRVELKDRRRTRPGETASVLIPGP